MTTLQAFLTAKRTVEDRALNRPVFERFADALDRRAEDHEPVRIVEIGAGTGSMIARLAAWDALPPRVSYRAVDIDADTVAVARQRLPDRLRESGYTVDQESDGIVARREADGSEQRLELTQEVGDGFELTDDADAVIAAAVLDLVDLDDALGALNAVLADGGVLYAPVTFNGRTSFTPVDPLDTEIERLYHRHMDEIRDQPGSSRAGQELLSRLPTVGYTVLAAGGSDWVIHPVDGSYPAAESDALDHLLSTIDGALADYPAEVIDPARRTEWIERRREQLERAELTLVAHHLDVLARL